MSWNPQTGRHSSFRKSIAGNASANSWKADFPHENGLYTNNCTSCGKDFMGHKRRTYCYHCACVSALAGIDDPAAFMRDAREWRDGLENYQGNESEDNFRMLCVMDLKLQKHLKGGAE